MLLAIPLTGLCLALSTGPPLPVGVQETAQQATGAALTALSSGRSRLQLTIPAAAMLATARHLVGALEEDGTVCRVFMPRALLSTWSRSGPAVRCSVFGLDQLRDDDGALVLVAPANRAAPRTVPEDEPDGHVLESVQLLLIRARGRPIIMLNPDLEALVLSPRPLRPVRPMFMADFDDAFFLATAEGPEVGDTVAVRRAYPGGWEVFRRSGPFVGNAVARHSINGKPLIADLLATENKRAPHPTAKRPRRGQSGLQER
jgi:hypothetical protein